MRFYWSRVGPLAGKTGVLTKKRIWTQTYTHTHRETVM